MLVYLALLDSEEDKSKFEKLYLAHRQGMYYTAYDILKDPHLAEDAVHQAFLKLVIHLRQTTAPFPEMARAYLVTIARNCAVDIYNKRKNHDGIPFEELTFEIQEPGPSVEESCDASDNLVAAAILKLPEHYAAILRLKYGHELPDREIAHVLSISEENVRKRAQRARQKLASILCEMEGTA